MLTGQRADLTAHTIATTVHGRYLVRSASTERLLIGFHGYAETAEIHLAQLEQIPGIEAWSLVSVQALHPFYPAGKIGASWMTSQDRDLAIADNIAYVRGVVDTLPKPGTLVFAGFSQGAAMAYRAAANIPCDGIIVLGGDLPPDVRSNLPPVLAGRGVRDEWYTAQKLEEDLKVLRPITTVTTSVFDGGHEWTAAFREAASDFLQKLAAL